MKLAAVVNHPSQYYVLKNIIKKLLDHGWDINYFIKDKDILTSILEEEGITFTISSKAHKRSKFKTVIFLQAFFELLQSEITIFNFCYKNKVDLLIGTDTSITHIGRLFSIPSFVLNEDDFEINKLFCGLSYPFATKILSPIVCNVGKYNYKKICYNGYQKLTYLHPYYFNGSQEVVLKYKLKPYNYFIIRLVSLTAIHDITDHHKGITIDLLDEIVSKLRTFGQVIIFSEGNIPARFENYKLNIKVTDIHHIIQFSRFFISDSQSMSVECAVLGTPFIRFNDFVNKISVLNELENNYKLGFGIPSNDRVKLKTTIQYLLDEKEILNIWEERRNIMLKDKIDVVDFIFNYIINYFTVTKYQNYL